MTLAMVEGQVTEAEYIAAHYVHRRRVAIAVNGVMAIFLVVGLAVYLSTPKMWGMILAFAGIGGFFGEFMQGRVHMPAKLRRLYAQTKGHVPLTYSWDEEKLYLTSERGQATRPWG